MGSSNPRLMHVLATSSSSSSSSSDNRRRCSDTKPMEVSSTETPSSSSLKVPFEILEEIFLNLPPDQVVRTCRLVCRQWKELTDSDSLWIERCRREGYHPRDTFRIPRDWRLYYFMCKKRRNLIKNPRAEDDFNGWQILQNGGDRWVVEEVRVPHVDETVKKNFVTSYDMCRKMQLIDLKKEGYSQAFMDELQPDIKISDWYAPRFDCGSIYTICVKLLNKDRKPIQTFSPEDVYLEQWNNQQWNQMTHVFQNYGRGVRYIEFTHGGRDTQFWAGWYGIRLTESCVEICPSINR